MSAEREPLHAHEITTADAAAIRMLAGAQFGPDASVTLPSGRSITGAEIARFLGGGPMSTLSPDDRATLTTIRSRCEHDPIVPEVADHLRTSMPDLGDVTMARVILATVEVLKTLAHEAGVLTEDVHQVLGAGALVAAELAALEIGGTP